MCHQITEPPNSAGLCHDPNASAGWTTVVLDGTEVQHVSLSMRSREEEVNFSLHSHMIQLRLRRVGGEDGG